MEETIIQLNWESAVILWIPSEFSGHDEKNGGKTQDLKIDKNDEI